MTDPLEELLREVLPSNGKRVPAWTREKITPIKRLKIRVSLKVYSDTERFRWYFHKQQGRTLQQWRDWIDQEMRDAETKCLETD